MLFMFDFGTRLYREMLGLPMDTLFYVTGFEGWIKNNDSKKKLIKH